MFFFLWRDFLWGRIFLLAIAVSFEVTDMLDGYYARKKNEVSDLGKLLDPFADSFSRFTVLLSFAMAGFGYLWMIALIFYRDITVAYIRTAALKSGKIVSARVSGKIKAMVQGIGITLICSAMVIELILVKTGIETAFPYTTVYMWIMGVITFMTVLSGFDYIYGSRNILLPLFKNKGGKGEESE